MAVTLLQIGGLLAIIISTGAELRKHSVEVVRGVAIEQMKQVGG